MSARRLATDHEDIRRLIAAQLDFYRMRTRRLVDPLNDDDLHRQHHQIMSPLVWDIGHVGNFEELWLLRELDGRRAHDERFDEMYNPFDNPRWTRGDLPLLDRREAQEYIDEVRGEVIDILRRAELDPSSALLKDGYVFRMVIQHEAQHQETMLQALDLRTDMAPYANVLFGRDEIVPMVDDSERIRIPGGPFSMGTEDRTYAYDNERPLHEVEVPTFLIDRYPVTNRRFVEFVESGGYDRRELWSPEGWEWRTSSGVESPQGWMRKSSDHWSVRRFGYVIDLEPMEPVQHVSFFEAEAFARYAGGRLPTEAEWEKAAAWDADARRPRRYPWGSSEPVGLWANVGQARWGPARVGSYPNGASAYGVEQMLGDVYEWTVSRFVGYPGFSAFPYPEYSEVFFDDAEYRVLRGASWATSTEVTRNTFRNWDYRVRRQIFSGIRLVWDA